MKKFYLPNDVYMLNLCLHILFSNVCDNFIYDEIFIL